MKNGVINQVHCQFKEIDVNISFLPSCPRTDKLEVVRLICEQLSCLRKNTSSWLVYQSVSLRLTEFDLLLDIHSSAVSAIRLIELNLKFGILMFHGERFVGILYDVFYFWILWRCLYFDLPYGLVKIRRNSFKYSAILHTKPSSEIWIYIYIFP